MKFRFIDKYHLKTFVPIAGFILLISSILIGFTSFSPSDNNIEKYDDVKIDYTVWVSFGSSYDEANPIFDSEIWLTMIPITENDTNGLILGLYNNLLGRELYYESGILWLDKCIDQDRDGVDDITGEVALTYGNNSDLYFNTPLVIKFRVLEIQKREEAEEISFNWEGFIQFTSSVFNVFFFIFQLVYPILLVISVLLIMCLVDSLSRRSLKIEINWRKLGLISFNISVMTAICISIAFITFWIVNVTTTSEELYLLKTRYDFFINSVITLIVLLCMSFIISYLLVWRLMRTIKS